MSESLTINTLNQGHFTHTHTLQPYAEARMGPGGGGGGGKRGRAADRKGESSIQGPRGQANRAEFQPWTYLQGSRG